MKLSDLKINPNNPRTIRDARFKKLCNSIRDFPKMMVLRPIVYEKETGKILGGNMRYLALKALKFTEIPDEWVRDASELTEDEKRRFIIEDNMPFGEWDMDVLANAFDTSELVEWGFDEKELGIEPEATKDAEPQIDRAEELNKKWQVKPGNLWQIGKHRLLCGDSTKKEDVEKVMGGEKAELLFSSPPYSDMRDYSGDDISIERLINFINIFYDRCEYQVINLGIQRKNNEIFEYWNDYIKRAKEVGYKFLSWNVWNREGAGFSMAQITAMFAIQHEWIFVFGKDRKQLNLTIPNKDAGEENDHCWNRQKDGSTKKGKNLIIRPQRQLGTVQTMINEQSREFTKFHPAVYPLALPSKYIEAMTKDNDCVADLFLGSGTTMVACQNLNRKCRGIEISAPYVAVCLERMAMAFPGIEIKRL